MEHEYNYDELPEDLWEQIVNSLGDDHPSEFESLSLVNKRLLSLTNRLRRHLTVVNQTYIIHGTIRPLLYRFPNLKTLDLSNLLFSYRDTAIKEIARSSIGLNLQSLDISSHDVLPNDRLEELASRNCCKLKVLKCANVTRLTDTDLNDIGNYFSNLEELDISYPRHKFTVDAFRAYTVAELMITDDGLKNMALRLKNLVKIDLSMNILLTDNSLLDLSMNCVRLQEVKFLNCMMITMKGLRYVLKNCTDIRTIYMSVIRSLHGTDSPFVYSATSCRRLSSLYFKDSDVSDEFLRSIMEARIPLMKLCLPGCYRYTISGITSVLSAYQSLTYLDCSRNNCLSDETVIASSPYLRNVVKIKLNFCCRLTGKALFALINNCSFLEEIKMEHTDLGTEAVAFMGVVKRNNFSIKTLKLAGNSYLTDDCLLRITSVCPNLKFLDVSSSRIAGCVGLSKEPLKLQTLCMARSGVNDDGLVMIAMRCNDILKIDLEGCRHVTTNAVKYLLKNCKKLRELNLMGCPNLHVFIVEWMVRTRPSLKKLIPPSFAVTNQSQRMEYLREHGCYVCDH
ncbi:EIN3-binding F-box protein 1-like isoform X2 [Rutidosis leptorrhynchoides]|uniref:EIN3-binding F-box protein 1-like isoform X2 n=1 Tax=Rutidosis leptorrhynchoides TaxID=125765 RepID=UPI003A98F0A1